MKLLLLWLKESSEYDHLLYLTPLSNKHFFHFSPFLPLHDFKALDKLVFLVFFVFLFTILLLIIRVSVTVAVPFEYEAVC